MAKLNKPPKRTSIGGQAVMEGVMMRSKSVVATSVRDPDGNIQTETRRINSKASKSKFLKLPVVRGVWAFFQSMVSGVAIMMRSAEVYGDGEPSRFEKWLSKKLKVSLTGVIMFVAVALGLLLSVLLFVFLPQFITTLISNGLRKLEGGVFNLVEGGFRMLIFVLYILLVSALKDIRRVFMYHGAEHKTINCFEQQKELTVENIRGCSRVHNRCGTTFLFFVMFFSILIYSVANISTESFLLRFLSKLALLPVIAGLSYELLKLLAATDSPLVLPLKAPGLLLQRLTTLEPDDSMIEVAKQAFLTVMEMEGDLSVPESSFAVTMPAEKAVERAAKKLAAAGITEPSEAEWLVCIAAGIKRSQIGGKIITPRVFAVIEKWTGERLSGAPLWYVIGHTEFYGIKIKTDSRALIPRPETEELAEIALKDITADDKVLDLCCGGGAIAVAIKKNSGASVSASDISERALELARENALANGADIEFIQSDLFDKITGKYSVIISNPPYIKTGDISALQTEVKDFEPLCALDGGEDGLNFYRKIAFDAPKHLFGGGCLFLECGQGQAKDIENLLKQKFTQVLIFKDFAGIERIIKATL